MKMHSTDLTEGNIDRIAELFPAVITESQDGDGKPVRAIDFDRLRQEMSDYVIEGPQERYQLDWPGKRESLFAANAPISKTLRPMREESVNFDATQNLFIEGDNLDVLKLLQESYLGKVNIIYIDPPYNTGKDFVYEDDFAENSHEYLTRSGQEDESGNRLIANPESNGRFHSIWLSMMYARLKLARNLLTTDGFLFVSIDDGEVANLRLICDELFGASNFVCSIMWRRKRETSNDSKNIAIQGEYILVFSRSPDSSLGLEALSADYVETSYRDPTKEFSEGQWRGVPVTASKGLRGGGYEYSVTSPTGTSITRLWSYPRDSFERLVEEGRIYWGIDGNAIPQRVIYAHESKGQPASNYWDATSSNKAGKKAIIQLFGDAVFDTAKPVALIQRILRLAGDAESIVLDFFAGASTAAHAVLAQNALDGGRRRFIMVQLDEPCAPASYAARQGYKTIADLSMERIRRAGRQIAGAADLATSELDIGFRALKVDTTNMADVLRTPDGLGQDELGLYSDSVKPGRSAEDLLFQVLLDWGLELTMSIAVEQIEGHEVFVLEGGALVACFSSEVSASLVREIARRQPLRAVFRDSSFAADADRINAQQVFAEVSPAADVKVI